MDNQTSRFDVDDFDRPEEEQKKGMPKIPRIWVILGIIAIVITVLVCVYFAALRYLDNSISMMTDELNAYRHICDECSNAEIIYHVTVSDKDDSGLVKSVAWMRYANIKETGNRKEIKAHFWQFENKECAKKYFDEYKNTGGEADDRNIFTVSKFVFDFPASPQDDGESYDSMSERGVISSMYAPFSLKCCIYRVLTFDFRFDDVAGV